jgi:hypothetical protein
MAEETYWLFLLVPPLAMGGLVWAVAQLITRLPKLPD